MLSDAFDKYILIVALFAAFLLLANVWAYRTGAVASGRLRYRRRGGVRPPDSLEPDDTPPPEGPDDRPAGLLGRWHLWLSVAALLACIAALLLMWWAMTMGIAS